MNKIRQLREAKGMTQVELAAAVGVNQSTINRYEAGVYIPGLIVALRLVAALDCTMADIVGDKSA